MEHPFLQFHGFTKSKNKSYNPKKIATKLKALFADNAKALDFYNLKLVGLLEMVNGLEYHYKNFAKTETCCRIKLEKKFKERKFLSTPYKNAFHEVIAYLNRLGQIYYLFTSPWFRKYVKESDLAKLCPTLLALTPLRHRVACHRGCDKSPNHKIEIDEHLASQASVAIVAIWQGEKDSCVLNMSYKIKILKEEKYNRSKILRKYHIFPVETVEIFTEKEIFLSFIPSKHHNNICKEIIDVIEFFFSVAR